MAAWIKLLLTFLQIIISLCAGIAVYTIFSIIDYKGGVDNIIGVVIFHPLFAIGFSLSTITICLLIGLPIRINKTIYTWWSNKIYIPISSLFVSFILLLLSLIFMSRSSINKEGEEMIHYIPNTYMALTGWVLMFFSILHIFPPTKWFGKDRK